MNHNAAAKGIPTESVRVETALRAQFRKLEKLARCAFAFAALTNSMPPCFLARSDAALRLSFGKRFAALRGMCRSTSK